MSVPAGTPANDEIARVAHAIWEAEGQPEGRDHEHWMRARQLTRKAARRSSFRRRRPPRRGPHAPRPVQPGFEDAAPGMVPRMKDEPGRSCGKNPAVASRSSFADLPEGTGGRLPGGRDARPAESDPRAGNECRGLRHGPECGRRCRAGHRRRSAAACCRTSTKASAGQGPRSDDRGDPRRGVHHRDAQATPQLEEA